MKRLFLLLALAIFLISPLCATAQQIKSPVSDILNYPNIATTESQLFKKWKGEDAAGNVPDIYDFSSAGYKQGEEGIPEAISTTVINVTDYGATPNDFLDDTAAIQRAFDAATSYTIIYFPPGIYDVLMTTRSPMKVAPHDHIVVQGAGGQGWPNGGTTIHQHQSQEGVSRSGGIFSVRSRSGPTPQTNVRTSSGATPRLVNRYIDVVDASVLIEAKYVVIGGAYTNEQKHFEANIKYRTREQLPSEWTDIQNALHLHEYHEVDYIDTDNNRVYLKANVANSYGPQHTVKRKNYVEGIGFQDLHFDCSFTKTWDHDKKDDLGYNGRNAIQMTNTANSWVKHVRISKSTSGIEYSGSIHTTIIGIIFDQNTGHYTIVGDGASHVFIALIEDHSSIHGNQVITSLLFQPAHHGISVQGVTSGIVAWGIGGPQGRLNGPDAHGWQSTNTLFDNYYSVNHQTSGTAVDNRPNHLLGYIRYNNTVHTSQDFDSWEIPLPVSSSWQGAENALNHIFNGNPNFVINPNGGFQAIEAIASGYNTQSGNRDFTFVEGWADYVYPKSLYVAQLTYRLGYEPAWIEREKEEYKLFFNVVFGYADKSTNPIAIVNTAPSFNDGDRVTRSVDENQPIGTNLGDPLVVTDVEHTDFNFEVLDSHENSYFTVDNEGQIKTNRVLNYEEFRNHEIKVKVDDKYGGEAEITVDISIIDDTDEVAPDPPQMTPVRNRTPQVRDAIMRYYPGKQHYDEVRPDNLAELDTLELSGRGITALKSGDFDGFTTLRYLMLSNNELTTLPNDIFDGLGSVIQLNLDNNRFITLPKLAFKGLDSLNALYLNGNQLTTLSETQFAVSAALKHIQLMNNEIETIHKDAFGILPGLASLYLNGNKLTTLPEGVFEHTPKLKYLNISDNEFTELPTGIFKGLNLLSDKRSILDVSGNPTDPLPIPIDMEKISEGNFRIIIPIGLPTDIELRFIIENGSVFRSYRLKAGDIQSEETFGVNREPGTTDAVTITFDEKSFSTRLPKKHEGYNIVRSANLPLVIIEAIKGAPKAIPDLTRVLPNFPNPFNPETWIPYQLAKPANVSITIFNSRGVVIRELLLGIKPAGFYSSKANAAHWDGRNRTGEYVSSGIYFYQFKTGNKSVIQKMVIMK